MVAVAGAAPLEAVRLSEHFQAALDSMHDPALVWVVDAMEKAPAPPFDAAVESYLLTALLEMQARGAVNRVQAVLALEGPGRSWLCETFEVARKQPFPEVIAQASALAAILARRPSLSDWRGL